MDLSDIIYNICYLKLKNRGFENFDLETELDMESPLGGPIPEIVKQQVRSELKLLISYEKSRAGAILDPITIVVDPEIHEPWYDDYLENNPDRYHWNRLERFSLRNLSNKLGENKASTIIRKLDNDTESIISYLENPLRDEFNSKGLVVGYVQSGKTANFTALIAKAVDAGYGMVIVLAGIHNILRKQTQIRLDQELTGMDDLGLTELGKIFIEEPSDMKRWLRLSTAGPFDQGEFSNRGKDPFNSIANRNYPVIAIVKKNTTVLEALIQYFDNATLEARNNIPLLVIDDEADQASIDGNANTSNTDPTKTNQYIRIMLNQFRRKAYVGYTATPFANVLIDMHTRDANLENDLYPRNFIASLSEPDGYFGSKKIFNSELSDNFIENVGDPKTEKDFLIKQWEITDSLKNAIYDFLIGCAIRNLREDSLQPMSMLVHVSHLINDQVEIHKVIDTYFRLTLHAQLKDGYGSEILKTDILERITRFLDNSSAICFKLGLDYDMFESESIWNEIYDLLDKKKISIIMLNSESEQKLDYDDNIEQEFKVIAIGGNQLSRGLTLEGLMTSYYLRNSLQYDTLLQMGRWFGYRTNYEDLTRIHTTYELWDHFEHLAQVEEELRQEIQVYADNPEITPNDVSVRIKDHSRMSVTGRNKLGAARSLQSSYSGSLCQTIWFSLNKPETLRSNYNLGNSFISKVNQMTGFNNKNGDIWLSKEKVDGNVVLTQFLKKYSFVTKHDIGGPSLDSDAMIAYIERRINENDTELSNWSIGVPTNLRPVKDCDTVNYGDLNINRIVRNRYKHVTTGYKIGVMTDPKHLISDLDDPNDVPSSKPYYVRGRGVDNPLLLLYLIWGDSRVKENAIRTVDLYNGINRDKIDVLGVAVILPYSNKEPFGYIGQ